MKMCPQCRTPYTESSLNFCAKDGTRLVDGVPSGFDSQPNTLMLPGDDPTAQAAITKRVVDDPHLQEIIEYQRKGLRKYVLVEKCEINSSPLSTGKLYVEFTFHVVNYSMFYVSIPMAEGEAIKGSIHFKGDMLSGPVKLVENNVKNSPPYARDYFKVRQWVSAHEATDISETLKTSGNLFDFSNAIVPIRGGDKFTNVEEAQLDLTRGMQNTDLGNKIVELGNENIWLRRSISLWQDCLGKIEELTRTLGMFYLAYNQLEQGEILSQETANNLKGRCAQSLHRCFHNNKITDDYTDNLPAMPDSIDEQKTWVDSQCSRLRTLIEEQYQRLSEYIQKVDSIPSP